MFRDRARRGFKQDTHRKVANIFLRVLTFNTHAAVTEISVAQGAYKICADKLSCKVVVAISRRRVNGISFRQG